MDNNQRLYQLLAKSVLPDNEIQAQLFLHGLGQEHPELMPRFQKAFGLVHRWILELREASLAHGDPLFNKYFSTGRLIQSST